MSGRYQYYLLPPYIVLSRIYYLLPTPYIHLIPYLPYHARVVTARVRVRARLRLGLRLGLVQPVQSLRRPLYPQILLQTPPLTLTLTLSPTVALTRGSCGQSHPALEQRSAGPPATQAPPPPPPPLVPGGG